MKMKFGIIRYVMDTARKHLLNESPL